MAPPVTIPIRVGPPVRRTSPGCRNHVSSGTQPRLQQLQDGRVGLTAALTHGLETVLNAVVPHVM